MAKRTTRITVETHSLTILRTRGHASAMWCAECGAETRTVTTVQAACICSATERTIFRLVESGRLHFRETPAGELLICVESLRRLAEGSPRGEP